MKPKKLLQRITAGQLQNVAYSDFVKLILAFGYEFSRQEGSHESYSHPKDERPLVIQSKKGEAKPYQIRDFLKAVEVYNLKMEENEDE